MAASRALRRHAIGPFKVQPDTTVIAISSMAKQRPSGPVTAQFVAGPVPPRLTTSERELPPATTGTPYQFTFTADSRPARYWLKGDLVPYTTRKTKQRVLPNGMQLDSQTGVWSGTPTTPGRYWIQIAVQREAGAIARLQNFTWTVSGEPLTAPTPSGATEDTNITLLHLPRLARTGERQRLAQAADQAGVDLVIQADDGVLVLAPRAQRDQGPQAVASALGANLPPGPLAGLINRSAGAADQWRLAHARRPGQPVPPGGRRQGLVRRGRQRRTDRVILLRQGPGGISVGTQFSGNLVKKSHRPDADTRPTRSRSTTHPGCRQRDPPQSPPARSDRRPDPGRSQCRRAR